MQATACGQVLQLSASVVSNRNGAKQRCVPVFIKRSYYGIASKDLRWHNVSSEHRRPSMGLSRSCKDSHAPTLEAGYLCASLHGNFLLKTKAEEVSPLLDGRSLFLVGMMGSGKTTVGKILAEALGYSFVDSDKFVEQVFGGTSVTQIFNQHGESCFRDYESEALQKLSMMPEQVVATGGGAVVRPINWEYMKQGVTVYLDVPVDALARRIAAVGTDSRPLLHVESGDPYTKAFVGLFTLSKKRLESYATADVSVSLLDLANSLDLEDIADITPTAIAIEVLVQIEKYFRGDSMIMMFP